MLGIPRSKALALQIFVRLLPVDGFNSYHQKAAHLEPVLAGHPETSVVRVVRG
jgi:hypothetical protein